MININEKGITIIALIITVLLLIIITGTLSINTYNSMELSSLTMLEDDIKILENRIASYYVENGELPILDYAYTKTELQNSMDDLSINDGENYYVIDFSKIDNITLNYSKSSDTFIINEVTHNVYYLQGIAYGNTTYHTVRKNDNVVSITDAENIIQINASNETSAIREESGNTPLTLLNCSYNQLLDYKIYGKVTRTGEPSKDNPAIIYQVGDLVTNSSDPYYGKYKIPVVSIVSGNSVTTNIYLDEPLRGTGDYYDYIDFANQKVYRYFYEKIFDGTETWDTVQANGNLPYYRYNITNSNIIRYILGYTDSL